MPETTTEQRSSGPFSEQPKTPTGTTNPPVELPEDHPLVKSLAAQKAEIRELKAKASKLDEIEAAQKSAEEKAAEREAAATRRAEEAEARALRREVALEHSLTKDDAALLDGVTDEDAMRKLAGRLASGKPKPNHIPTQGTGSPAGKNLESGRDRAKKYLETNKL